MSIQSKIFFAVFFLCIFGSVFYSYYKFILVRDYFITAQIECDPMLEACFTHVCDPEADEECTDNPEEDTSYYKLIRRNAMYMPVCNPSDEGCEAFVCPVGEEGCELTLCDEETLAESEENSPCNDPVEYVLNYPTEEEETDEMSDENAPPSQSDMEKNMETILESEGQNSIPNELVGESGSEGVPVESFGSE